MSLVMSCMIEYHNGNEAAANDEEWEVGVISRQWTVVQEDRFPPLKK